VLTALLAPTLASLAPVELRTLEYASLLPPDLIALAWLRALVGAEFPEVTAEPEPGAPDPWRRIERRLFGLRLLTRGDTPRLARMHRLVGEVVAARPELPQRQQAVVAHATARGDFLWQSKDMHGNAPD